MTTGIPAIEIKGLSKSYRDFSLRDVAFSLPQGTIMGMIGPNGAGKTTIIKLLLNLLRRDTGEVRMFGLDARAREVEVKRRIGFVHDAPFFCDHLSLRTLKAQVAPFYPDWDEAEFRRLLDEFELPAGKRFGKLSRGMKMKFSLALALSHHADLLLLDEPTSGLDPVFRRELLGRLSGFLQDPAKSVLFSTHITTDLERIADHVTFVRDGRVVFSAPKDETLERWAVVKGGPELLGEAHAGLWRGVRKREFVVQTLTDDVPAVRRAFPSGVAVDKASLEDIMFYLTRGNGHA
jgi:ABC-2 type transport system ATP-binding protein